MRTSRHRMVFIVVCLLLLQVSVTYAHEPPAAAGRTAGVTIEVEGKTAAFAGRSFIVEGTTLAPAEPLADALGYAYSWSKDSQQLTLLKDGWEIKLAVGSREAIVNGEPVPLLQAPELRDGEPFIPLRFAAEQDGREVKWIGEQRHIVIREERTLNPIRIMVPLAEGQEIPVEAYAEWSDELYRMARIVLDWEIVPETFYVNKLMVMIAAGHMPDIAYVPDAAYFPMELLPSFAAELDSLESASAYLAKLPEPSVQAVRQPDGKSYGIPKAASPYDAVFPVVRKDWLDLLGLAVPETMDQLYEVMRAFTERDPDRNGKYDTYGLVGTLEPDGLGSLAWVEHVFNGAGGRFVFDEEGRIRDTWVQEGTREALEWLSRAYQDGLLALAGEGEHEGAAVGRWIAEGHAGIIAAKMNDVWRLTRELHAQEEPAVLVPLISLRSDDGAETATMSVASDGMYVLDARLPEEKKALIFRFLDTLTAVPRPMLEMLGITELVDSMFGVPALTSLPSGLLPDDVREEFEQVLQLRSELDMLPSADLEVMKRLSNEQRAALNALNKEAMTMKKSIITGEASIEKWPTFVAVMQTDPHYIDIMEALR